MSLVFPLAAFFLVYWATGRALGLGFCVAIGFGYFNGLIRGNYEGVASTFTFDAGLLGLYLGTLIHYPRWKQVVHTNLGRWVQTLVAWPAVMTLVPINHFLIQLVALRATVFFLPVILVSTLLDDRDRITIGRGFAVLNIVAAYFATLVYFNGLSAVFPLNAATELAYRAFDVAGGYPRNPASFLNAHSYAGTMLVSLPWILNPKCWRGTGAWIQLSGLVCATGGIFVSGTRSPIVVLAVALFIFGLANRLSTKSMAIIALFLIAGGLVASRGERFQRILTLGDTELVTQRIELSANEDFFSLVLEYPLGAGMGSAFGTSIPSFLAQYAPKPKGMENEFSRILVDQGLVGLALWIGFLLFALAMPNRLLVRRWSTEVVLMYAISASMWLTAFIGTGTLASIPSSVVLLAMMGQVCAARRGLGIATQQVAPDSPKSLTKSPLRF